MSETQSEVSKMSSVIEASTLIRVIGGDGPVKSAVYRASRKLGWAHSRTKDIWYKNARRINAEEMDRLRQLALQCEREQAIADVVALRRHMAAGPARLHSAAIAALDTALRELGAPILAPDDSSGE